MIEIKFIGNLLVPLKDFCQKNFRWYHITARLHRAGCKHHSVGLYNYLLYIQYFIFAKHASQKSSKVSKLDKKKRQLFCGRFNGEFPHRVFFEIFEAANTGFLSSYNFINLIYL